MEERIILSSGVFGTVYREVIYGYPTASKEMYQEIEGLNVTEYEDEFHEIMYFTSHKNIVSIFEIKTLNSDFLKITMELMYTNLTHFLEANHCLALDKSIAILYDVSCAIHYLHSLEPTRFHGNLHSGNIFLTRNFLAKVGDIMPQKLMEKCIDEGVLRKFSPKIISADRSMESLDIFSFSLIVCHVFSEKYPEPKGDANDHELSEFERYEKYLNLIKNEQCKELAIQCLSSSPPPSSIICDLMKRINKDFSKSRIEEPGEACSQGSNEDEPAMLHTQASNFEDGLGRKDVKTSKETASTTSNDAAAKRTMVSGITNSSLKTDYTTDTQPNNSFSPNDSRTDSAPMKEMEAVRLDDYDAAAKSTTMVSGITKTDYSSDTQPNIDTQPSSSFSQNDSHTDGALSKGVETMCLDDHKFILPVPIENLPNEVTTKQAITPNKYSDLAPEMIHLIKFVVPKIKAEWEDVAYALKYEIQTVNSIKEDHHGNPKKCCKELLKDWLVTGNGKSPKTWSTLLDALRGLDDLTGVIHEIEKDYNNLQ